MHGISGVSTTEIGGGIGDGAKGKARMLTLADVDRRTAAYKNTRQIIAAIEDDLGGGDILSTAERQMVQRAGVLGAILEDIETRWIGGAEIDPVTYTTVINAQRRMFEILGTKRRAKDVTPDLRDYLAGKPREAVAS